MVSPELRKRWRFFLDNAGSATPPGRAACALSDARAEELLDRALSLDVATFEVVDDPEPYDPGDTVGEEEAERLFDRGEWNGPYGCVLNVGDAHASLWGIVVGRAAEDDPYLRVVRAELADELLDDLRQAIGDALDSRMEVGA